MDIPTPKRTKMLVFHKNIHIYSRYHSELLVEKCNPVHSDTIEPRRIIVMKEMVNLHQTAETQSILPTLLFPMSYANFVHREKKGRQIEVGRKNGI